MSYVMGIDIGTYESKGVLVDQKGQVILSTSVPHKLEVPQQGWAEHDAEKTWWGDLREISQTLVDDAMNQFSIDPKDILAVGISSIAPAVVPIDKQGNPLRKAILYGVDTRTKGEIEFLNDDIGKEVIFSVSKQSLSSQSAGPKILWIRNHEPRIYEKTKTFLSGAGFLVYKLTNKLVMDHYTAASFAPMYDLHKENWNSEMVQHITDIHKLPNLAWSHEIVGTVTAEAAEVTGLMIGTKVIAGTADALAESISIGAVKAGDLMMMYGSSTFFILVTESLLQSKTLWANIHAVPHLKTITGGTSTAGSLTRWFVDQWLKMSNDGDMEDSNVNDTYRNLTKLASQSPPGANGLITLPYFSGERTPIHHQNAKGVFFGLSLHHTTKDIYRSIIEGIAYSIRHNVEEINSLGFKINRIIAVGGGTKNPIWLQSVSDSSGLEQMIPRITIGAAFGNAFLCALALGWYTHIEQIEQWVQEEYTVFPREEYKKLYDSRYQLYKKLYQRTFDIMDEL
jgi:xylulokinase